MQNYFNLTHIYFLSPVGSASTVFFGILRVFGKMSEVDEGIHIAGGTNHGVLFLESGGCFKTDPK